MKGGERKTPLSFTWRPYLVEERVEPPSLGELARNDGDDLVARLAHCLDELGAEVLGGLFFLFVSGRFVRKREEVEGGERVAVAPSNQKNKSLSLSRPPLLNNSPRGSLWSGASRYRRVFGAREHQARARAPRRRRPAAPCEATEKRSE
jgi:hypothetical protein